MRGKNRCSGGIASWKGFQEEETACPKSQPGEGHDLRAEMNTCQGGHHAECCFM